ncbi:MAG TPA: OmpH family outer membrane protein [Gemmatimonadales bacterium]|nr:OmpH family outer membrane protein [Gemmatimonadales bacterium]
MQRLVLGSLAAIASLAMSMTAPATLYGQGAPAPSSAPATSSQAPAPAPVAKIAFINSQEILQRTPGYAVAESTYRKELQASQAEVQKLQTQLDSAVQALDQQSIALSPAARAAKQKDLQTMQQRMEQRGNELQTHLQQREQELLGPLRARINSVLQGIRAEMNYSLIIDADAGDGFIAALDPALNITTRVLQRLSQAQ